MSNKVSIKLNFEMKHLKILILKIGYKDIRKTQHVHFVNIVIKPFQW